jgi:hypothetical protein
MPNDLAAALSIDACHLALHHDAARVEKSVASTGPAETHRAEGGKEPSTCEVQDPLTCATADATPPHPVCPYAAGAGQAIV